MIPRKVLWALPLELTCVVLAMQPSAAPPQPAPLRELPWAQLNFLHTTDTHGWHAGHLQEPSFGADWGDYVSFTARMGEKADKEGVDLILVDTGDRIEGSGLYDASEPKGKYDLPIFEEQDLDVLCAGNHELYQRASIEFEVNTTVPRYGDHYLASNLDYIDSKDGKKKPLSRRSKKFTTKHHGIRIMAMGFIFDFSDGADNIVVQKVEDAIKENWFKEAISDREVDLFLIAGHVPAKSPELDAIYKAIRQQQWDTPIQFLGGHTHIRDYVKYDAKAWALESGRYMETIGFASIDGLSVGSNKTMSVSQAPKFARRYIDNNLFSLYHHSGLNSANFPTPHGLKVSQEIQNARKQLKLDTLYGCAPHDYWTNRAPFPAEASVFSLLQDKILPQRVTQQDRKDKPRIVLTNTGSIRFDVFEGKFTQDTLYAISPFINGFRYIKDVPWNKAKLLLRMLNQDVPQAWSGSTNLTAELASLPLIGDNNVDKLSPLLNESAELTLVQNVNGTAGDKLFPGYTTRDAAGSDGDDTLHSPIKFYYVPNCVESQVNFAKDEKTDPEVVDVVYNAFLQKYILLALKFLGTDYDEKSTGTYADGETMTNMIGDWVKENWTCKGDAEVEL